MDGVLQDAFFDLELRLAVGTLVFSLILNFVVVQIGKGLPLPRTRFLITSVLNDKGRTTP